MKIRILIILLSVTLTTIGQDTESEKCYKIKYLDFFRLDKIEVVKWPESEIKRLMKMNFKKERSVIKTNFIIPFIIYQLKEYHPNCKTEIDTLYFNKISKLYLRIREIDTTKFTKKTIGDKINFMCADFFEQVKNVDYLPKMTMTFDDGPFYGVNFDQETELKPIKTQKTDFGLLGISKVEDKTILTSKNKNGDIIWQKSITGLLGRNLNELNFNQNSMEYNSLATVAHMYSEGERFTLYLKKDGRFMYYFHSW